MSRTWVRPTAALADGAFVALLCLNETHTNRMNWQFATLDSSADSVETLMFEFEDVLRSHGILIHTDSALDRTCLTIMANALKRGQTDLLDPSNDPRLPFAYALGLWQLMMKVVRLRDHPDFPQIVPHLREINNGSFAQNVGAEIRDMNDPTPAKMFELLIALAAMDIGTGLALDHPTKSNGDNPDVMVTIDGTRWAFACGCALPRPGEANCWRTCDGLRARRLEWPVSASTSGLSSLPNPTLRHRLCRVGSPHGPNHICRSRCSVIIRWRRISLMRVKWPSPFDFSQSRTSLSIRNEI